MLVVLFLLSVLWILYTYALFPLLLRAFVRVSPPVSTTPDAWPTVDVIVSAYNEEQCIAARVRNILDQDYAGELGALAGSDGSTDSTCAVLQSLASSRVKVVCHERNRGKISVLNDLVARSTADILVFTDANSDFRPDAVRTLVSSFTADVGAVCGELVLLTPDGNQNADGAYWRYEQALKRHESSIGGLLGANGAIYALRRELYRPLPANTVIDDFSIAMNVRRQGLGVIYNPLAIATEEVAPNLKEEFRRRVRIGAGNYQALLLNFWALSPSLGVFAWCFWSHKVMRWFVPHAMVLALVSNALLLDHGFFRVLFVLQLGFYLCAWIGSARLSSERRVPGPVALVTFFVSMNVALGQGFIRFMLGRHSGAWRRTDRSVEERR